MEEMRKTADGGVEIPDAVKTLLSNPALLKGIGAAIGSMQPETPKGEGGTPSGAVLPTDGLSALLSNPQAMEKLPQVIAALCPMMTATAAPTEKKQEAVSAAGSTDSFACRDRLLLALKPFLSPARCEAVDTILQISRLGAVFKEIK